MFLSSSTLISSVLFLFSLSSRLFTRYRNARRLAVSFCRGGEGRGGEGKGGKGGQRAQNGIHVSMTEKEERGIAVWRRVCERESG